VRHTVLPVLEAELGPGVAATLARTADQLRRDMESLDELAVTAFQDRRGRARGLDIRLDLDELAEDLPAIAARVLRLAALEAGSPASELFAVHINALEGIADGSLQGQVQLPGHVTAYREDGELAFRRTS
jgi:tRNA(Ile)-lysidine synthase